MKTDWFITLTAFQLGFCVNASMWRLEQGQTEHVGYPIGISVVTAVALICRLLSNRSQRPEVA